MQKYYCEKIKLLASYYLHGNKDMTMEDYWNRAPCIFLHHFNDQSCCDTKWCKVKRCLEEGISIPTNYCVNKKFGDKHQHAGLYKKISREWHNTLQRRHLLCVSTLR